MTRAVLGMTCAITLLALPCCGRKGQVSGVPIVEVRRTAFARTVDADGYLKAEKSTAISPVDAEGEQRLEWIAADGTRVKTGDVVARFADVDLRSRLADAQDDRTSALTKKSKEALLVAQARSDRRRTRQAADRDLALGRTFARKDPELYSRDDIVEGEIDETLQGATASHAQNAQIVDGQVSQRKLRIQDVAIAKVQEQIKRAKKGLKNLELRAPHDGVLIIARSYFGTPFQAGDQVFNRQKIAEIPLVEKLEAEVFVLEAEAAGLAKGKKAEIVLESLPGRVWGGAIKEIQKIATRRQAKSPTQYFGVTLTIDRVEHDVMKPGQRVRAKLLLDQRQALVMPRPALFDKDGKWAVYRRDTAGFSVVSVKLGTSTAGLVVIESGLNEGDVVALRDPGQAVENILAPATKGTKER